MKVIQLLDNFNYGGGERVALTYRDTFSELGFHSLIVAIKNKRESQDEVYLFPSYVRYFLFVFMSIFKEKDSVILMAHTNRALFLSCLIKLAFLKSIKLIYVQHLNYNERRYKIISLVQLLIDKYIQITPVTEGAIKKHIKIDKVFYINNYIDVNNYPSSIQVENLLQDLLDEIKSRQVITFVGAFRKGKNVCHIQELIKRLDEKKYFFLIIGDGFESGLLDRNLIESENVRFLGYQNNPLPFMKISDYIYFPSYDNGDKFGEMMPMTVLEALEMNCKVIAYDLEVNKFLLPESNIFSYKDFDSIVNSIESDAIRTVKNRYDNNYGLERFECLIQALEL